MKSSVGTLSRIEISVYFFGWIGAIFYGIYHVYLRTSKYFDNFDDVYGDFSPGWNFLNSKRDNADPEWRVWIPFIYKIFPWICIHLFVGQIVKYIFDSTLLCCWYVVIGLTFIYSFVGLPALLFLLLQPILSCLLIPIRSKLLLWIFHLLSLAIFNAIKSPDCIVQKWLGVTEDQYNILTVALAWVQLRTIGFSLDIIHEYNINNKKNFIIEFLKILAYCLYLPTLFLGQLILYKEFVNGINTPFEKWNLKRAAMLLLNLLRYLFWILFTELSLHFIYFNILHYHPDYVRNFNSWALYGFGYCMGQYFSNKYVVVYGFSSAIARAENIADLHTPKCIGRIHLYSDMWKYFDRGLHNFLVRYIYLPFAGKNYPLQKVFASFVCFSFIYVWHGTQTFILIWSVLNFLGLMIENLARAIASMKIYIDTERKLIGPNNARRFHCILASPLLAMSAISNFYFFGGAEIGNIFMQRIFSESWRNLFVLFCALYCCCQLSTELKIKEIEKIRRIKMD